MMASDDLASETPFVAQISAQYHKLWRQYQHQLDRVTPFVLYRWIGTTVLAVLFGLRILLVQGVSVFISIASYHTHRGVIVGF
jgi:hypothetical protein